MRCAFCHGDLETDAGRCDGCGTRLHLDCARTAGTCPTLGCGRAWAPAKKAWAAPPPPARWRRVATAVCFLGATASLAFFASRTPFYGGRGLDARARHLHTTAPLELEAARRREAHPSGRTAAPTPSLPAPRLPGDAPADGVLLACRALLDDPELRHARLGPDRVAALAPDLSRLRPTLVVVERAAVVVDLGGGKGLVALPAGGRWEDVEAFTGTRSYTLEKVIEDLWLFTRW